MIKKNLFASGVQYLIGVEKSQNMIVFTLKIYESSDKIYRVKQSDLICRMLILKKDIEVGVLTMVLISFNIKW